MTKRKLAFISVAVAAVVSAAAFGAVRQQLLPGRDILYIARLVEIDLMNVRQRVYVTDSFQPNVDRTYSFARIENPSKGLVCSTATNSDACKIIASEAAMWVSVNDTSGRRLFYSENYGVVTSGPYTYTYALLPPPAIAAQGRFSAFVFLPLLNTDGSPKYNTPFLSEWTFTNF